MHIILNACSSNEHENGDCDYAAVDLTPALTEQIRRRVALARRAVKQDIHPMRRLSTSSKS